MLLAGQQPGSPAVPAGNESSSLIPPLFRREGEACQWCRNCKHQQKNHINIHDDVRQQHHNTNQMNNKFHYCWFLFHKPISTEIIPGQAGSDESLSKKNLKDCLCEVLHVGHSWLVDWQVLNGTFNTNRLYHATGASGVSNILCGLETRQTNNNTMKQYTELKKS